MCSPLAPTACLSPWSRASGSGSPRQPGQVSDSPAPSSQHSWHHPMLQPQPSRDLHPLVPLPGPVLPTPPHPSEAPACLPRAHSHSLLSQGARPDLQVAVGTDSCPMSPVALAGGRCKGILSSKRVHCLPGLRVLRAQHGGLPYWGSCAGKGGMEGLINRQPRPETRLPDTKRGGRGLPQGSPSGGWPVPTFTAPLSSYPR